MNLRRYIHGMLLSVSLTLSGCGFNPPTATKPPLAPPPTLPTLTAPAIEAAKEAVASEKPLIVAEQSVSAMPDSPLRTKAITALGDLRQWWSANLAKWNTQVEQAKAQDVAAKIIISDVKARDDVIAKQQGEIDTLNKKISKLEAGDPVVTKLNWAGVGLIVLCIFGLGIGIWANQIWLRNLAFVVGGMGLAILTLAKFLHTVEYIIGGIAVVALIGAVVYVILHKKIAPAVASVRAMVADATGNSAPSSPAAAPLPQAGAAALAMQPQVGA